MTPDTSELTLEQRVDRLEESLERERRKRQQLQERLDAIKRRAEAIGFDIIGGKTDD